MTLINHGKPTTAGANRLAPASFTSHGGTCKFQGILTSYCPSIHLPQVLSTKSFDCRKVLLSCLHKQNEAALLRFKYAVWYQHVQPDDGKPYQNMPDRKLKSVSSLQPISSSTQTKLSTFHVVAFGLLASQVTATIALGNNANNICKLTASIDSPRRTCWESAVMWIYSDNSCSGVVIPSSPVNVSNGFNCEYCLSTDNSNRRRPVRLANGPIYVDIVRGCGTDT